MKRENFNIVYRDRGKSLPVHEEGLRKPRILVAPLDWGLGHATRCIPVIYELLRHNCEPWLAGEGSQEVLLKQEFPNLPFLPLKGYRVRYGRSATGTILGLIAQSGKILGAIKYERDWLEKMAAEYHFDAVISDNRFGLFHTGLPTAFMTHQLKIKSAWGKGPEILLQKGNYSYINRFSQCWVPDLEGEDNLAGDLSHPHRKPATPLHYMGPLSRFYKTNDEESPGHLLVILSGPEPQRSIFENKIVRDIAHYNGTATIVRGLPGSPNLLPSTNSLMFYNHLGAGELNREMNRAGLIISRSGYSTVMDVFQLGKKAVMVATPGQTEQEYLAKYLMNKNFIASLPQDRFSLAGALELAKSFPYAIPRLKQSNLQRLISEFVTVSQPGKARSS